MAIHQVRQEKLFVVVDPRAREHLALYRALITSKLRNPAPEICVHVSCDDNASYQEGEASLIRNQLWFDQVIRQPLNELMLKYEITVSWQGRWPEELLNAAKQFNADVIMLPGHASTRDSRLKLSSAKRELLRNANCPVVLVRRKRAEKRNVVLAAVNFQATNAKQLALNERILGFGRRAANRYSADIHVVNAYRDSLDYPDRGQLARQTGLSAKRIHVRDGYTDNVVAAVTREIGADLVVIGALNQRGSVGTIRRGNTAARVIAAIDQDIMIVN